MFPGTPGAAQETLRENEWGAMALSWAEACAPGSPFEIIVDERGNRNPAGKFLKRELRQGLVSP